MSFLLDPGSIELQAPTLEDGIQVHQLIQASPPLDINSSYCYLLLCSHFAKTSIVAKHHDQIVGFTSGYTLPNSPETLFIWQVAVAEQARGTGIATKMVKSILARQQDKRIQFIETTIAPDNLASQSLFQKLAADLSTSITTHDWMDKTKHFLGQHDSEPLVRIGPF